MFTLFRQLPLSVRPTYYYNLRAALFNGVALGVGDLFHTIASKELGASSWQLAMIDSLQGLGLMVAFVLGSVMVGRRKTPFIFWPRVTSGIGFFILGWVDFALGFCLLAGMLGLIGHTGIPAMTGILRSNYPARIRGMITGFTRRWFFLVSLLVALAGSELIHRWSWTWKGILPTGGLCALVAGFLLHRIKVRGEAHMDEVKREPIKLLEPFRVLKRDRFFRNYMIAFFIFGLANLMMRPVLPIVLRDDMNADFREMQWIWSIIPRLMMILTVGFWGRLLDRSNPISMRGWMNLVWAVLPLAVFLAPLEATDLGFLPFKLQSLHVVCAGRLIQGTVMAGQGLIWALGIMYFARKDQVPLYMGVHVGLNGIRAALAPWAGPLIARLLGDSPEARKFFFLLVVGLMVYAAVLMMRLARDMKRAHGGHIPSFVDHEEAEEKT